MENQKVNSKREAKVLGAYRHIGDVVYSALFNVPGEDPHLRCETICYIEVSSERVDFYDNEGCFIAAFESVGKWDDDLFSSFSRFDVEAEIEKWWKKKLELE